MVKSRQTRRIVVEDSSSDEDMETQNLTSSHPGQVNSVSSSTRRAQVPSTTETPRRECSMSSSCSTGKSQNVADIETDEGHLSGYPEIAPADDNTLRILVATDNHVGFLEKDAVRGDDSFRTLDEIFRIGQHYKADMVVFGGDLFHDNKPSRRTIHRVMSIFRKHVFGGGSVPIEILSDQKANFKQSLYQQVNYEDPNISVQMPVFIIHGNHDDPTREGGLDSLSAVDLLSVSGLVNYFGKVEKVEEVTIEPVLIRKGEAKLALYGMGWVRDERLNRLFSKEKVKFVRPSVDTEEWFNMFMVHQNRDNKGRGAKNCLHESMIPDFMNLVVFGHEHECLLDAVESTAGGFHMSQPGSSVATSLVEGEAREKQVGILDVTLRDGEPMFRLKGIPLKTVRAFVTSHVELSDKKNKLNLEASDKEKELGVERFLERVVRKLIEAARTHPNAVGRDPEDPLLLPLVRVRVEHTGFPTINMQRFGGAFVGKVANPNELLQFYRKRNPNAGSRKKRDTSILQGTEGDYEDFDEEDKRDRLLDLVQDVIQNSEEGLKILPVKGLNKAVEEFVEKQTAMAIEDFTTETLKSIQETLSKEATIENDRDLMQALEESTFVSDAGSSRVRAEGEETLSRLGEEQSEGIRSKRAPKRSRTTKVESDDDEDYILESRTRKRSSRDRRTVDDEDYVLDTRGSKKTSHDRRATKSQNTLDQFVVQQEAIEISSGDDDAVSDATQFSEDEKTQSSASRRNTEERLLASSVHAKRRGAQEAVSSIVSSAQTSSKRRRRRGAQLG